MNGELLKMLRKLDFLRPVLRLRETPPPHPTSTENVCAMGAGGVGASLSSARMHRIAGILIHVLALCASQAVRMRRMRQRLHTSFCSQSPHPYTVSSTSYTVHS